MHTGATLVDYIKSDQIDLVYQFYKGGLVSLDDIDFAILQALAESEIIYEGEEHKDTGEYCLNIKGVELYGNYYASDLYNGGVRSRCFISIDNTKYQSLVIGKEIMTGTKSSALWLFRTLKILGKL